MQCKFAQTLCGVVVAAVLSFIPGPVLAQATRTSVPVQEMAMRSGGSAQQGAWQMDGNGFVGTYIRLNEPGKVAVLVRASGTAAGNVIPRFNIVIADEKIGFDAPPQPESFEHTFTLPAGTFFLRIEYTNDATSDERALTIHEVAIRGATVLNDNSDANALAAAETYINEFRRGPVTLTLPEVAEGTLVRVKLRRHAFNFGVVASGTETNKYFFDDPEPGSDAWKVQQFMTSHFNAVVPGNAGKWAHNEAERGKVTMDLADAITRFGQKHNMRVRMHTLLWDTGQQPQWASDLLAKAVEGDEAARKELRQAVQDRMGYYLTERGRNWFEIDGLNEHYHRPRWYQAFGPEGIAEIYTAAAEALEKGGSSAPVFTNEYNVFQWSENPIAPTGGGSDPYANWYREYVESLQAAGGKVGGIGAQYYVLMDESTRRGNPHSPARMMMVWQNLSGLGLPLSLTEFGVQSRGVSKYDAADYLEESARMTFGMPGANTFMVWGFWEKEMWDQADAGAMVDADWNLLPAGRRWIGLMAEWDTDLLLIAGPGGEVTFEGFYGDYDLTAGDRTYPFTHEKGQKRAQVSQGTAGQQGSASDGR